VKDATLSKKVGPYRGERTRSSARHEPNLADNGKSEKPTDENGYLGTRNEKNSSSAHC